MREVVHDVAASSFWAVGEDEDGEEDDGNGGEDDRLVSARGMRLFRGRGCQLPSFAMSP